MFALAHLSDPHLAPLPQPRWTQLLGKRVTGYMNWRRKRHLIHDPATLARIVADMKAQGPDHVAVSGDIANIALPDEFPRGRDWLEGLGAPHAVSLVPGNHDIYVREAGGLAARHWGAFMSGDDGAAGFPYLRRRGPIALLGVNTGVPTAPFLATGWIGTTQLVGLAELLHRLKSERLFRVVMLHHPPISGASRHKRLLDADVFLKVIAEHGADLVIHGHDHLNMINWLPGPDGGRVPAVGVASASAAVGISEADAAYNIYRIDGSPDAYACELETRGAARDGKIVTLGKTLLKS